MLEKVDDKQVRCELKHLSRAVAAVLPRLETLAQRLEVVMRPPRSTPEPDEQKMKELVPLARSIRDGRLLINEAVERLDSILDRLEI